MELELSPDLESKLARLAEQQGRSSSALAADAIEQLVDHDAWFRLQVQIGLDEMRDGHTLTHEDVGRRLGSRFPRTSRPLAHTPLGRGCVS